MGSIPLPALDIHPPQQQDPLAGLEKLQQLKSLMNQQQIQQQTIASGQQDQQIKAQQIKDQQATTAAMKSWDGKDYDVLAKSVLANGGSATAADAVAQHGLTIKKTISDIAAQDAATGSKNLETFIGKQKAIGDTLEGLKDLPDEQLHQGVIDGINKLAAANMFDDSFVIG